MKIVSQVNLCHLAVRPGSPYWEILCADSSLARHLHLLSRSPHPCRVELIDDEPVSVIPLTPDLDAGLVTLVDALIHLRYETGRVQLELFTEAV